MTKLQLTCCFFCFSVFANAQNQDSLLFKAYKKKSIPLLQVFFERWSSDTPPVSESVLEKRTDTVKNIYYAFQTFYDPLNIDRNGGSEWGNSIYNGVKYLLIQDRILFGFVDTLDKSLIIQKEMNRFSHGNQGKMDTLLKGYKPDSIEFERIFFDWPTATSYDTLNEFRPRFHFDSVKTVTLTKYYSFLLNNFLGNTHYRFAEGNIMSPASSKGESNRRQKFLENFIKIWYGHWGGYWQLYSYPYVTKITFDRNFENAIVNYQMIYEGGYAYLKKVNSQWKLIEARRTWIE